MNKQQKQEFYNHTRDHLLEQGKKCQRGKVTNPWSFNGCLYRKRMMACALGASIPDDFYNKKMECEDIENVLQISPELYLLWNIDSDKDFDFLRDLQQIHDENNPEDWKDELDFFAHRNRLKA